MMWNHQDWGSDGGREEDAKGLADFEEEVVLFWGA